MTDDLTPERARARLALDWGHPRVMDTVDAVVAAWERDRAELLQRRRECARCGQTGLHPDGVHSCYDLSALSADYYQQWQEARAERDALRERLDAVRDALIAHDIAWPKDDASPADWKRAVHKALVACLPVQERLLATEARLAEVTKQRDALVDAAESRIDNATGMTPWLERAADALAAIRAEREATRD